MQTLRSFAVWFGLGAGLLTSGLFAQEAIREIRGGSNTDFLWLVGFLAVSGGFFSGLLALGVKRLAAPPAGSAVPRGEVLIERANELGVSLKHLYDSNGNLLEPELQRRVLEAEKSMRERRGYIVAVAAALIAGVSAVAAWITHIK